MNKVSAQRGGCSIEPVLHAQAGDEGEVADIAREQEGVMRQAGTICLASCHMGFETLAGLRNSLVDQSRLFASTLKEPL